MITIELSAAYPRIFDFELATRRSEMQAARRWRPFRRTSAGRTGPPRKNTSRHT